MRSHKAQYNRLFLAGMASCAYFAEHSTGMFGNPGSSLSFFFGGFPFLGCRCFLGGFAVTSGLFNSIIASGLAVAAGFSFFWRYCIHSYILAYDAMYL